MNPRSRPSLHTAALCFALGSVSLLTGIACGRIDLGPSTDETDDTQGYPRPIFTLGPGSSRTVFGPGPNIIPGVTRSGDEQLGGNSDPVPPVPPDDAPDASVGDASVGDAAAEPPALVPTRPDAGVPASTDSFYLDEYEVTPGRFAQFDDDDGWRAAGNPAVGAGLRYNFPETGWQGRWNTALALDADELRADGAACSSTPFSSFDGVQANPTRPVSVTWYAAFAFCARDVLSRLPLRQH